MAWSEGVREATNQCISLTRMLLSSRLPPSLPLFLKKYQRKKKKKKKKKSMKGRGKSRRWRLASAAE